MWCLKIFKHIPIQTLSMAFTTKSFKGGYKITKTEPLLVPHRLFIIFTWLRRADVDGRSCNLGVVVQVPQIKTTVAIDGSKEGWKQLNKICLFFVKPANLSLANVNSLLFLPFSSIQHIDSTKTKKVLYIGKQCKQTKEILVISQKNQKFKLNRGTIFLE